MTTTAFSVIQRAQGDLDAMKRLYVERWGWRSGQDGLWRNPDDPSPATLDQAVRITASDLDDAAEADLHP